MNTRHVRVLLVMLFAALLIASVPGSAHAQTTSLFLRITTPGFSACGTSTVRGHEREIILRSVEENLFHTLNPNTGLPVNTNVDGRTLKVIKDPDPCSPALFLSTLEDGRLQRIDIFFVGMAADEPPLEVATIQATNVQVVGFNLASDGGGAPSEIVTFALFGTLKLTVPGTSASITRCWSFAQNKVC